MSKHLDSCLPSGGDSRYPPGLPFVRKERLLRLVVSGRHAPEYWLHVELPAAATLATLDRFLRRIWLECCGHMSAFTIGRESFFSSGARELGGRSLSYPLERVLIPYLQFSYSYDFGSTTELALKVTGEREGLTDGKSVRVLARDDPPDWRCQVCGKPATQICTECSWEGAAGLCDDCSAEHECDEDLRLPVVNSPRVGTCGYVG
jgi:hypothetical protein